MLQWETEMIRFCFRSYAENQERFLPLIFRDHSLATRGKTSIQALTQALTLLKKGGMISLCIYSGGDSGFEERDQILDWLKNLDPHQYLVIKSEYYNRPNNPPIPVLIIKN